MYFYIYLQPEVFDEAIADGDDATQNITSILSGFLQNCFITEFEDNRWGATIKEKLEIWPENMTRKSVKSLLVQLKKRNRIIYNLIPDYDNNKKDIDCVFEQATEILIDLIVLIESESERPAQPGVEVATRRTYQNTVFEPKRSDMAVDGITCIPGEMDEAAFMDLHFLKVLRHASTIHICDRMCGKTNFAGNYRYTIDRLMRWLAERATSIVFISTIRPGVRNLQMFASVH